MIRVKCSKQFKKVNRFRFVQVKSYFIAIDSGETFERTDEGKNGWTPSRIICFFCIMETQVQLSLYFLYCN